MARRGKRGYGATHCSMVNFSKKLLFWGGNGNNYVNLVLVNLAQKKLIPRAESVNLVPSVKYSCSIAVLSSRE
eukprot:SAG11_NODE_38646_length_251_cov_1.013158_1_plen_72_part_01